MNKHVNKIGVLEIVTKLRNYAPNLQTWWLSHQTSLIAVHQIYVHRVHTSTTKASSLSRFVRALTIKKQRWGFWYPFSFGSLGVSLVRNPNIFISKIYMMYLSK